ERDGTLNSSGGRGGDAGSVTFYLRSEDARRNLEKAIHDEPSLIDVSGGSPGPVDKLRSPSFYAPVHSGTKADFGAEGVWPVAASGSAGDVIPRYLDTATSLGSFLSAVQTFDGVANYSMKEFVQRVRNDRSKDAIRFDDYVASR